MQKNWTTCIELDDQGRTKYSIRYETLNEQEFNELKAMVDSFYRTHEVVSAIKNGGNSEWLEVIKPTELEDCPEALRGGLSYLSENQLRVSCHRREG